MSYSFNTPPIVNDGDPDIDGFLADAFEKLAGENQRHTMTYFEAKDHLSAATAAAIAIVKSFGDDVDTFTISVTGHANPAHKARDGWSHEFCQVNVSVKSYNERKSPQ